MCVLLDCVKGVVRSMLICVAGSMGRLTYWPILCIVYPHNLTYTDTQTHRQRSAYRTRRRAEGVPHSWMSCVYAQMREG